MSNMNMDHLMSKNCQNQPSLDRFGFVLLTDVIPDMLLEIRYYSSFNIEGFFREINGDPEGRVKITFCDSHFDRVRWGQFKNNGIFIDSSMPQGVASIFSEGSLSMIVSLAALVTSIAAIGVSVMTNKKKSVPANAEGEE